MFLVWRVVVGCEGFGYLQYKISRQLAVDDGIGVAVKEVRSVSIEAEEVEYSSNGM